MLIPSYITNIVLPDRYRLVGDSIRIKGPKWEVDILLNNNSFEDYDSQFNHLLSQHLHLNPHSSVLDIGGGYESRSVIEMMERFPTVEAMNIDLVVKDGKFSRQASATALPINDLSIDVIVCFNSIAYLIPFDPDAQIMVDEIVRVLKQHGLVFISPNPDIKRLSKGGLEIVTEMYGKSTYGKVYRKVESASLN